MVGIREFLKRKSTGEGEIVLCRKEQKSKMPITSAMSCHDIADRAGISEEQLTDLSYFETDLMKQPK